MTKDKKDQEITPRVRELLKILVKIGLRKEAKKKQKEDSQK
jgi:hypothetical protein